VNYGDLRLIRTGNPLRGDPRFEKIVAFLAPDAARYYAAAAIASEKTTPAKRLYSKDSSLFLTLQNPQSYDYSP